tara:strand:+ start:17625 stop:17825 length:201 start_codon:yes stop_codon:yes gene_type:complete
MKIYLNGKEKKIEYGTTIAILFQSLEAESKYYAIEVNRVIIPKSNHQGYIFEDGDKVEVVTAIGGG